MKSPQSVPNENVVGLCFEVESETRNNHPTFECPNQSINRTIDESKNKRRWLSAASPAYVIQHHSTVFKIIPRLIIRFADSRFRYLINGDRSHGIENRQFQVIR